MKRILVTGAAGQVGTELVPALRALYGEASVLATDLKPPVPELEPYLQLDCTDRAALAEVARSHSVDTVYHLAALLSARAEQQPLRAWEVNMNGLVNVLELARERGAAVFTPSSIAAFGPDTPRDPATPQVTIQRPTSMYGVTKVAGELLADYYHRRFGVDARGVRYPGLISYVAPPGGGTTDYAVDIFYHALQEGEYSCFLREDTRLDMMYMPDAIRGTIELMEADAGRLKHRNAFNMGAMQFTPAELAAEIRGHLPGFRMHYQVDPMRQAIADSWPRRLDDSAARAEWGWAPQYDLAALVADMLDKLGEKLGATAKGGTDAAR
jgi:nucleoside-diphosphate-sugar epimerase